jgi:quercetin dioxygenase-like cupin family protein
VSTQLAPTAVPIDYMGMQAVFRVTKEMSGGSYQAFENITPPGTGVPLHMHPTDDETLFVEQGRLSCVLGERRFVAGTGDSVRLPAGTSHAWSALGDETAVVLVVVQLRSGGDFERMFRELSPLTPEDFQAATAICEANAIELTWPLVMA